MATITIDAEQARVIARLAVARQEQKDAKAKEDAAKAEIESWGTKTGDVLTLDGLTVAKIVEGTRSGLDAEIVKRRAPGAYRQAMKTTRYRTVKIA